MNATPNDPVFFLLVDDLEENLLALEGPEFTADELAEIDRYATDSEINLWAESSKA